MLNSIGKILASYPSFILEVILISKQEVEILELPIEFIYRETSLASFLLCSINVSFTLSLFLFRAPNGLRYRWGRRARLADIMARNFANCAETFGAEAPSGARFVGQPRTCQNVGY